MPEHDEVIAGRYRLQAQVGRGAAGVVWRARDERLDRVVALKFLTSGDVERVVREGRVAARLRHPHAISVHDVIDHGGRPCLVLEYLPSRTLADLTDAGPLPESLVAGVGWQVASALAAAHAAGIVHRDVSPFNILLTDDGTAKIADFGIARAIGEGTVTDGKAVVGTPAFWAPEVAAGAGAVFASDVYSLGAVLHAALEGRPPTAEPGGDGLLAEVLALALRRDPAERPTMADFCALLDAVVAERPAQTRVLDEPTETPPRRAWRRTTALAAAAVLVAAGITIGLYLRTDETPAATPTAQETTTPQPTATTTTAPTTTPTAAAAPPPPDCTARFKVTNSWPGGYQAEITVRNARDSALRNWTVTWPREAGHVISNLWNGAVTAAADSITVTNLSHNARLPVAGSTTFGFTANGPFTRDPAVTCESD
ncbi:serine/threonine-protein kinase [Saccharothrix sp. NPDC042600]|uniref:serine/threonine-protein kinase n=1 Tax=Saccharothrix TaxID=2071 RepID=UPI0033CC4624|nr:protein kinase [Saccharothrix mutabilis subsp. capreolus]